MGGRSRGGFVGRDERSSYRNPVDGAKAVGDTPRMKRAFSWIFLALLLPGSWGCGMSTRETPSASTDIRVEVDLTHDSDRFADAVADREFRFLRVVLRAPGGAAIEDERIHVFLNGDPLLYGVGVGNYYDRHPSWHASEAQLRALGPDTDLAFSLEMPDGTPRDIGAVRAADGLRLDDFTLPRGHGRGRDMEIRWRGVTVPARLVVYRGMTYPNEFGDQVQLVGSPDEKANIRRTVGPGFLRGDSGKLRVPASFLEDQPGESISGGRPMRVTSLSVQVTRTVEARVSGSFHPASRIRTIRKLEYYIPFAESAPPGSGG